MTNPYYNGGSFPSTGSPATSASMRAELAAITTGFDKLPTLSGNGGKLIAVNSGATGLEAVTSLSVLSVVDSGFTVVDNADATKKIAFEVSGVTTGTTRTITAPDADLTLVGTATTQTLTNKTISADNNTISGIAASSFVLSNASGNLDGAAAQKAIPTGAVVGDSDTQTLSNKTLVAPVALASSTAAQDGVIVTGRAGGTSTFRVTLSPTTLTGSRAVTLPDAAGTVVLDGATQTLTNKTLTSPTINGASLSGTFANAATFSGANVFGNASGQTFLASTTTTQDGVVVTGRAGGSTSLRVTLAPGTLTASRSVTFPDAAGNVVIDSASQTLSGTNTFGNASGQTFLASTTVAQDGVIINGRAGGTGTFRVTLAPTTLTASRAITLPDAAGTITLTGATTISVPAAAMVSRTTSGAGSGTAETATNRVMIRTLDFDAATAEYAQFSVRMPKNWDEGTVTAFFLWSNATGTGNVVWGIQGLARSDGDALDTAFGTAVTVTDGVVTAAGNLMQSAQTGAITIGGTPAENDLVIFQVYRDAASGSDTLAADARLHNVVIVYTTNAANDA